MTLQESIVSMIEYREYTSRFRAKYMLKSL